MGVAARNAIPAGLVPQLGDLAVNYGVKAIQLLLNLNGATLAVDGVPGSASESVVAEDGR